MVSTEQLLRYEQRQREAKEGIAKLKHELDYLGLQIRQTKIRTKVAKTDKLIKAFCKFLWSHEVTVEPSPDIIYVSVTLSVLAGAIGEQAADCLGLSLWRHEECNPAVLLGPWVKVYKHQDHPGIHFYITQHQR